MRVLKESQPGEKTAETIAAVTEAPAAQATLSLRTVTILEIASVLATVLITAWAVVPLRIGNRWLESLPAFLGLALTFSSHWLRKETLTELGFTHRHFGRALLLLIAPTVVVTAVLLTIGWLSGSLRLTWYSPVSALGRSLWGMFQQYLLQAFIYRRVKFIALDGVSSPSDQVRRTRLAIVVTAVIFALVHAPNLPLMGLTLLSALIWTWVYERAPNLFALSLSHGLMSTLTSATLPEWALKGMIVGLRYFVY
jgi:membrane protease YdiL (CAAX protease family)